MKHFEFLSLRKDEFIAMVSQIAQERMFLKKKKVNENLIVVQCQIGIPLSNVHFELEEREQNLVVTRKISWIPLLIWMIPVLAIFEAINFFFTYIAHYHSGQSYLITFFVWLLVIIFLIYLALNEIDKILDQLYKVEVQ